MLQRTFERKSIPMVAWYMLSNESYMKRVINEVLPTVARQICVRLCWGWYEYIPLCSPRKTSLSKVSQTSRYCQNPKAILELLQGV